MTRPLKSLTEDSAPTGIRPLKVYCLALDWCRSYQLLRHYDNAGPQRRCAVREGFTFRSNLAYDFSQILFRPRIGQGGQVRMDWFVDENQAVAALVTLEASKRQRGYWVEPQQLGMFG